MRDRCRLATALDRAGQHCRQLLFFQKERERLDQLGAGIGKRHAAARVERILGAGHAPCAAIAFGRPERRRPPDLSVDEVGVGGPIIAVEEGRRSASSRQAKRGTRIVIGPTKITVVEKASAKKATHAARAGTKVKSIIAEEGRRKSKSGRG